MANPNPSPATRWKKGQSGNPNPKKGRLTQFLREVGETNDCERMKLLAEKCWAYATAGEFPFANLIFDRLDGKLAAMLEEDGNTFIELLVEATLRRKAMEAQRESLPQDGFFAPRPGEGLPGATVATNRLQPSSEPSAPTTAPVMKPPRNGGKSSKS